jgi:hypothetical protein
MSSQAQETKNSSEFQGLKIRLDETEYQQNKQIHIRGSFSLFVNCGSQYAIWGQFPQSLTYKIKNLDSDVVYQSINRELSISWNGNDVYENYAQQPCNQIVTQEFSENLQDIPFIDAGKEALNNFAVQVEYMNFVSDWLVVKGKMLDLKKF